MTQGISIPWHVLRKMLVSMIYITGSRWGENMILTLTEHMENIWRHFFRCHSGGDTGTQWVEATDYAKHLTMDKDNPTATHDKKRPSPKCQ